MVANLSKSISLRHIRAFIEVAEQGRFTAAANILAISQPALTTTINQLEDLLEVQLFLRTTRRVELTDIGKDFLPAAKSIVIDFDREIKAVHEAGKRSVSLVKVAVLPSLAMSIIPNALKLFAEEQPGVKVNIRDDNSKGIHQQVLLNESDFGITNIWEDNDQLEFTPLFEDRIGLVCHRDHPLAQSKSGIDWEKLEAHSFIGMSDDTGVSTLLHATPNLPDCVLTPEYEVLTMVALANLVHTKLAISALPALAMPRLVNPPLKFLKLHKPTVWRQVHIVTRKNSKLSTAAQLLRIFLQKILSKPWDMLGPEHPVNREYLRNRALPTERVV